MSLRSYARTMLRRAGYDVVRFDTTSSPIARRTQLLRHYGIDLLLDVGAHVGHYGLDLRRNGYRGRIISFEPRSASFAELEQAAAEDPLWEAVNLALGCANTTAQINLSRNLESSSLLNMLPSHQEAAPGSSYTGIEKVSVRRLDDFLLTYDRIASRIFVKIDTQGYERHVLTGAQGVLESIAGFELEMSLVPLYEGETLFRSMIDILADYGYGLMSIEPAFSDPTSGRLLQVDGIFYRDGVS